MVSGYDFRLGGEIHATPVGRGPEAGTTVDGLRDVRKIRSLKTLQKELCTMARYTVYREDKRGKKVKAKHVKGKDVLGNYRWTVNLGACRECESPCAYGAEILRRMPIHELLELGCGGDCMTCRDGCRLYRLAVQKITDIELDKAIKERRAKHFAKEAKGLARPPKEEKDPWLPHST